MRHLLQLFLGALIIGSLAYAQSPELDATWSPPTEGSPAVYYILKIEAPDSTIVFQAGTPDTFMTISTEWREPLVEYIAKVVAMDAKDRYGPWSEPAAVPVLDLGPPGACSNVIVFDR